MTPATLPMVTMGLQAGSSILGGMGAMQKARAEREHAERNAFIGETRAMQTTAAMTRDLGSELGTLRATLAANGQGLDGGTMPFMQELRRTRLRERRIAVGSERQGAADWRTQGRNATAGGRMAMLSGIVGAGPSLFDMWELGKGPSGG